MRFVDVKKKKKKKKKWKLLRNPKIVSDSLINAPHKKMKIHNTTSNFGENMSVCVVFLLCNLAETSALFRGKVTHVAVRKTLVLKGQRALSPSSQPPRFPVSGQRSWLSSVAEKNDDAK